MDCVTGEVVALVILLGPSLSRAKTLARTPNEKRRKEVLFASGSEELWALSAGAPARTRPQRQTLAPRRTLNIVRCQFTCDPPRIVQQGNLLISR